MQAVLAREHQALGRPRLGVAEVDHDAGRACSTPSRAARPRTAAGRSAFVDRQQQRAAVLDPLQRRLDLLDPAAPSSSKNVSGGRPSRAASPRSVPLQRRGDWRRRRSGRRRASRRAWSCRRAAPGSRRRASSAANATQATAGAWRLFQWALSMSTAGPCPAGHVGAAIAAAIRRIGRRRRPAPPRQSDESRQQHAGCACRLRACRAPRRGAGGRVSRRSSLAW